MLLKDHEHGLCLYGEGGGLASISPDTAKAIGVRSCPKPEVLKSVSRNIETCAGCLDVLRIERNIRDPAHPIATLADILAH
jgi:hypothetical protein